ncbi:MAG TPA: endonuclease/exonuclease/phosphatase family protein [Pseudolabrys sp.]|nr:endonuclease/exonuclease/phosphatase family protein [Pseudolabrys sp.]
MRPDIVCLQQVARRQSALVAEACELPHVIVKGALSILTRYPIVRSHGAALPEAPRDEPRQVSLAETLIDGRPLLVVNTHLAWRPEMTAERKAQVATLLAAIESYCSANGAKATILCSDFNDDPDSPALRLVADSGKGFHDAYAGCSPDNPSFTWWRKKPLRRSVAG